MSARTTVRDQSPLAEARNAIPEWVRARAQLDALGTYAPAPVWWEAEVYDLVRTALLSGEGITRETEVRAAQLRAGADGPPLVQAAFDRLRSELEAEVKSIELSRASDIFGGLHEQLETVLEEGRQLADVLGRVRDADEAIEAGLGDELVAFRDAGRRYRMIRADQYSFTARVDSMGRDSKTARSQWMFNIADPFAADPLALARRVGFAVEDGASVKRLVECPKEPWPLGPQENEAFSQNSEDKRLSDPVFDWGTSEAFDWLVRHPETRPWVPSIKQLDDMSARFAEMAQEIRQEGGDREAAKRRYRVRPTGPLSERLMKGLIR